MSALNDLASDYVNEVALGPARSDVFRQSLKEIQTRNTSYFIAAVVMLGLTFLVATGLIIFGATGQTTAVVIASVFGITVVGMIRMMLSFWREKVSTELLIELSELDDSVLKKVVARLLTRLK